jgi:diguanylate cyclase (GGDEF)-like protein
MKQAQVNLMKNKRMSLNRIFSVSAAGILVLFLLLTWLIYSTLFGFKTLLNDVALESLPNIVISSKLYGESSRLLEATEQLSKSNSDAARRLAEEKITRYLEQLKSISEKNFHNEFLAIQLNTINLEIVDFTSLIKENLLIEKLINEKEKAIYKLFTLSQTFKTQPIGDEPHNQTYLWSLQLSKTLVNVSRSLNMDRLQEVRDLFRQFNNDLELLRQYAQQEDNSSQKLKLTNNLAQLILQDEGLLPLKIKQLRIAGRVIGRENFVHNLIQDFARLLEYSAKETEDEISQKMKRTIDKTETETSVIGLALIIGVIFLIVLIIFIQKNIVSRLQILNSMVQGRLKGKNIEASLKGNDEITDLANSFLLFSDTIEQQNVKLEHMSLSDGLTNIANRRALDIRLLHDIELSIRKKSHVAVLLMDVDNFKLYNDNYGHAAGDECLKIVAKIIQDTLKRSSDFLARYGGEEFVCVLPNTELEGAVAIADQILQSFRQAKVVHKFSATADFITLSIGIAVSGPERVLLPDQLLSIADKALYRAKEQGKNQYCFDQEALKVSP